MTIHQLLIEKVLVKKGFAKKRTTNQFKAYISIVPVSSS